MRRSANNCVYIYMYSDMGCIASLPCTFLSMRHPTELSTHVLMSVSKHNLNFPPRTVNRTVELSRAQKNEAPSLSLLGEREGWWMDPCALCSSTLTITLNFYDDDTGGSSPFHCKCINTVRIEAIRHCYGKMRSFRRTQHTCSLLTRISTWWVTIRSIT